MKCTLIIGNQGSGKTTVAKKIAEQYQQEEVHFFEGGVFAPAIQFILQPNCRMIIVESILTLAVLKRWLLLARQERILISSQNKGAKSLQPEFVLVFQSDQPAKDILKEFEIQPFKVIQCSDIHSTLQRLDTL